jgi:TPR repeat protein
MKTTHYLMFDFADLEALMARFAGSILLAALLITGHASAADDPGMLCDALAGSPDDLDLPEGTRGVAFGALDPTAEAEAACIEAVAAAPYTRRYHAHLGRIYAKRGEYFPALEAYRKAHGRGSAVAANNIGSMYKNGQGVPANETRATEYFRKAAHRGLPYAMQTMATRARLGTGMAPSERLSLFWYERAYDAGSIQAANDLGVMYQRGYGVREDDERAMELFAEALNRDPQNASAAYNIASAYEDGEGVSVDYGWARGYYVLAFEAGDADAAAELGRLHAEGLGSVADPVAAASWYAQGTAAGSLYATVSLAEAHETGAGVEADAEIAGSLYRAALDLDPNDEWRAYIRERLVALRSFGPSDAPEKTE